MASGKIAAVLTGADRIVANGDTANKIGTYQLAVLAKYHKIPFFIAAPFSTFDLSKESGAHISIENRDGEEILSVLGINRPSFSLSVYNPAFDVTPHSLITALISEQGIIESPNKDSVKRHFSLKTDL
jgi:methylthioribose-1-phosphate isomerase